MIAPRLQPPAPGAAPGARHPARSRFALLATLALACALAACGGRATTKPAGASPEPGSGGRGPGTLIYTRQAGIYAFDLASTREQALIPQPTPDTFLLDPAVSPDGTQIAYVVQPPPVVKDGVYDASSDLWVANRDGSGARVLFTHAVPRQLVRFPQWLDAQHVLAVVQEPAETQGTTTVEYVLEQIDVASGARERRITGVLSFGVSPDRARIAWAQLPKQTGESLTASAPDGSGTTTLIGPEQDLAPFNSPRYSPDGTMIAFASADQTGARAPFRYVSFRGDPAPEADGLPEDIWTIPAEGGAARRVADLKEDLPTLTWGADSRHIYVLGANALSDVDLSTGAVTRLGEGSFHGGITWAPS
ncbi:MAG TPA: hypothetical protein VFC53_04910 [Dehalococcoidia bacterium]|nr:hypothetical protein [Dehalococcoidia bacterium]